MISAHVHLSEENLLALRDGRALVLAPWERDELEWALSTCGARRLLQKEREASFRARGGGREGPVIATRNLEDMGL